LVDLVGPSGGEEGGEVDLHRFVRERRLRLAPESRFLGDVEERRARHESTRADLLSRSTPEQKARFDALWQRTAAGDILRFEAYPRDIVRMIDQVLREHGLAPESALGAHIRGSRGSVGGLSAASGHSRTA
jgi:hypothetical protein